MEIERKSPAYLWAKYVGHILNVIYVQHISVMFLADQNDYCICLALIWGEN